MQAVIIALLIAAWAATMWLGFVIVFPILFPAALIAATAGALGLSYAHACRSLVPATAQGRSPVAAPATAYRHYLLEQVWLDWWAIAAGVVPLVWRTAVRAVTLLTRTLLGGLWGFFAFPVWLALCLGITLAALPAAILGGLLTLLYGLVAAVGLAGWLACALVMAAVERVFMAYGRILQTCPHPFCYEKIALPVYECPGCGTRHRRLTPGAGGALRHVCRCGARLPTTIPLGRFRLTAYCPHCNRRLPERIGRVRVEPLPFVGGPAAGKTTFMFLAIRALHVKARALRGGLAFVEKRHAQAYAGAVREFERGGRPAKTGPELPLATMVDVELPGAGHRILYLFDPAGEHYSGATQVESLRYLGQGEALLFVLDPFALPQVSAALTADEWKRVACSAPPSDEDPSDTLQRVLNELRARPDRGRRQRIAVVVTKTDLLVRTAIGRSLGHDDPDVRGWLEQVGLSNTVRTLDHSAAQVRYLGSGLDTEPGEVADLLAWVTGLSVNARRRDERPPGDRAAGPPEGDRAAPEVPGIAPLRDPWPVHGRDATLVPAGYQAGRWAILAGLSVLGTGAITLTVGYAIRLLL